MFKEVDLCIHLDLLRIKEGANSASKKEGCGGGKKVIPRNLNGFKQRVSASQKYQDSCRVQVWPTRQTFSISHFGGWEIILCLSHNL